MDRVFVLLAWQADRDVGPALELEAQAGWTLAQRTHLHLHRRVNTMPQTGLIENAHNDLVTDAAYDFYGLRLATCSLDQRFVAPCWTVRVHALNSLML